MPCPLALGFIEVWVAENWGKLRVQNHLESNRRVQCSQVRLVVFRMGIFLLNRSGCQGKEACGHCPFLILSRFLCDGTSTVVWTIDGCSFSVVVYLFFFFRLSSYSPQEQWSMIKHSTSPHIRTHSSASSQQGNTWTVKKDTLVVWLYGGLYSLFLWTSTAPEKLTCPADISHLPTSNPSFFQGRTESCGSFPGSIYFGIMASIWFNQLSQIPMKLPYYMWL